MFSVELIFKFGIEILPMPLSTTFQGMKACEFIKSCVNRTILSDVTSVRFLYRRMLKNLQTQDFG